MQIKVEPGPMWGRIVAAFPEANEKGVFYAYVDRIYNPHGVPISPALIAHEAAHGKRQLEVGVEVWWKRYIADERFRLDEEVIAHRAEYLHHRNSPEGSKPVRGFRSAADRALIHIAARLASPLYGKLINAIEARRLIVA